MAAVLVGPVTTVEDRHVSRRWIADVVSGEEASTQVQIVFTNALATEGLLALLEARADALVDPTTRPDRSCSNCRTTGRR